MMSVKSLCMPTMIYLVLAIGSILFSMVAGVGGMPLISQLVMFAPIAVILEMLCRYKYVNVAWFILSFLLLAPMMITSPLLGMLLVVLWLVYMRR